MTMTAAERHLRAVRAGHATKAKYGMAYYFAISKKSPHTGAPRIGTLAESLETAKGRRALADVASSYGVPREEVFSFAKAGRGGGSLRPAPHSSVAVRRSSAPGDAVSPVLGGGPLDGNAFPASSSAAPDVDASQRPVRGHNHEQGMKP